MERYRLSFVGGDERSGEGAECIRSRWPTRLAEAIEEVASARDGGDALARGLAAAVAAVGPGFAGVAFVGNGEHLSPAAAVGCEDAPLGEVRLRASELGPSLVDGTPLRCSTPAAVDRFFAQLSPANRLNLVAALGQAAPARVLCLPFAWSACCRGCLLLVGRAESSAPDQTDMCCLAALACAVAMAMDRDSLRRGAEEASRLKTEVISALSHQMRTPLASIKGYATALLLQGDEYGSATQREFLKVIDDETDKLSALIGDVLESSAMEAGLLQIEVEPVLLPRLAQEAVKQFAQLSPQHRFVVSFAPGFPVLHADPRRIEQVLHNLLDNAVKYSPDGGLVVVRGDADDAEAVVSVADQGAGIAPEHLNRLFERFFRVNGSRRRPVPGTGLGLPIARAIVETHGGRIWAESSLGRGSTFYFTLPRHGDEAEPD